MAALVMTTCPSSKSATVMRLSLCLGQLDLHQLIQQFHSRGFTTFNQQRNPAHHQLALMSVRLGQVAQDAGRQRGIGCQLRLDQIRACLNGFVAVGERSVNLAYGHATDGRCLLRCFFWGLLACIFRHIDLYSVFNHPNNLGNTVILYSTLAL